MTVKERYNPIINAEKYSAAECHDISKWLCYIRDAANDDNMKHIVPKIETMLQAFITRKKLGDPVNIKQLETEFLGIDP